MLEKTPENDKILNNTRIKVVLLKKIIYMIKFVTLDDDMSYLKMYLILK